MITDFKLRYQGSVLGYLWALLRPLFLFVIMYVVFVYILKVGANIPHWPVALLLGIVLWNFFSEITKQGLKSVVSSGGIIRKINFPKYIIVVSTSLSAIINLLINLVVVGIFAFVNQVEPSWGMLLLPVFVIELYIFALGIAFILGTLNVKFRDVGYIWEVVSQALFYGSAIMFPVTRIIDKSHELAIWFLMNPLALTISDARHFVVTHELPTIHVLTDNIFIIMIPHLIAVLTLVVGAIYFRKRSPYFAEEI